MSIAPTTRDYSYKTLVVKTDKEHYDPDIGYVFSNGRKFHATNYEKDRIRTLTDDTTLDDQMELYD